MLRNQSIAQNVSSYTDAAVLSMTCPNGMNPVEEAGTVEHDNEDIIVRGDAKMVIALEGGSNEPASLSRPLASCAVFRRLSVAASMSRAPRRLGGAPGQVSGETQVQFSTQSAGYPERFPDRPACLGETVGHGKNYRRVVAQAAMAAGHFDVLGDRAGDFLTGLPGHHAVGSTEYGARGHGRRRPHPRASGDMPCRESP